MTRFRVAVVGTGHIAEEAHLPAFAAEAGRTELVAAVDIDAERADSFAVRHGIPAAYTDLDAMLRRERPDLVVLCSPPAAHLDAALSSLRSGAWVWLEKPPFLSLAEFDLVEAAERQGGPYASVIFQQRSGSGLRRLVRQLDSGELGRPLVAQAVTTWYRSPEYYAVPWRGRWDTEGGGTTLGHGIHQMDLLLAVLGPWAEVRAMAARLERDMDVEDVSTALVRFESGALATVVNSALSRREESYLRFDFSEASVELRHLYGYGDADWTYTPERLRAVDGAEVRSSHTALLPGLLDAMDRKERPPLSGRNGGREALELVTALYQAAFTGATVRPTDLLPDNPFYQRLHGGVPEWARC
ncbi:Gfo/Idh/MocA family protein [Streptacidiphilus carbonis]|jgi:predicted dehydrogenase|uniref:Gfo/Idh/MocA family protein n=1 Tax=Streptacidiphilus carbonis TaxID=105422 RepID=UPI0005A881F8|nr:Gfo/Idh/MocA family oxidoreductase [Streptacidiphilus carbonis]